ncbi:hypothetical protein CSC2_35820 [Clostridium zeae]|uniref:Mor transcription activator domain-containing protein n=1 Tax=Clostridium zeae TaxID=2759022 RepID=A0ABQ1EE63_9CLOT|nr:CD3324 family protein [Clostridium zeae]GFZ33056.1 hypothetical protein CSC2_35820 [Clostridium zeae]
MKCAKIETILPESLVKEIQKYIQGEYIYIPNQMKKRKKWGENSGSRAELRIRNEKIQSRYNNGCKIEHLAEEFFLSIESIKKIVYVRNK